MVSSSGTKKKRLLALLSQSLSTAEIEDLLPSVLLSLDRAGRDRLARQLDEDTGETLLGILRSVARRGGAVRAKPGNKKLIQEWHRAWEEWNSIVDESSRSEGKYVYHEHHWEAPFLNTSALLRDLEAVAVRLRELLPAIVQGDFDPELNFIEVLRGTAEAVGAGLPEWYLNTEEEHEFGPEATKCLLEWEWSVAEKDVARRPSERAFVLADKVCELESSTAALGLDPEVVAEFFLGLDARQAKNLLGGIEAGRREGHWKTVIESIRSTWFPIYQELCRRWRPEQHLESCRQNVAEDWRLAVPVVTELVQHKEMEEALSIIEEAMSSMLRFTTTKAWDPTATLLVGVHMVGRCRDEHDTRIRLLQLWSKVARANGLTETAWALDLQGTLCRHWENLDRSLVAFARSPSARSRETHDRLFVEWRSLVAERSTRDREAPSWVDLLVDAAHKGMRKQSFARKLRGWLRAVGQTKQSFEKARRALEELTLDLDRGSFVRKASRGLHAMLSRYRNGPDALAKSRRKRLRQLDAGSCLPDVLAVWKRRAADLVPDPARSGSHYTGCAEWLEVVFQLDRLAYQKILHSWSVVHKRRRNLWQALTEKGLPLALELDG